MLEAVKKTLRITHTKLDDSIQDTINTARAELIRLGILASKAEDDEDPLIRDAIKTFCQMSYTDDEKKREMFYKSWEVQADGLRKSSGYRKEGGGEENV
jgi:uncharacterized phage protein (predicted DNA packaging)